MAQERVSMRKIREILRLRYEGGLSYAKIAQSTGIGETTVSECLSRATAAGVSWPLSPGLDDEALEAALYPPGGRLATMHPVKPDYALIHAELRKKSVTLQLLWQEYKQVTPGGYQYSQFCLHYKTFKKTIEYAFRNTYKAGEKLFVDYAGQTVPIHCAKTGDVHQAQIFIAVLGASSYTYAEASWSQELPQWIASHVRAFGFFGGTTEILIPDNLKSAVTRACRYDPDINPAYYHMATHYQTAVIPARPYRPKDKAKAEAAVLLVERWILAVLRKRRFFSLAELNAAIKELLDRLNTRPFRKMRGSRRELFEQLDKPALRALPERAYEHVNFKLARVNINYHVEVDGHNYSVPYTLVQRQVEIRYGEHIVEVLHKNQRVASHRRSFARGNYTTLADHMPPSHRQYTAWTPERMIRWAGEAGEKTAMVAAAIMRSKRHPEQGFKAVLGMVRLGDKHGKDRLEAACEHALAIESANYRTIKSLLALGFKRRIDTKRDTTLDQPTPAHANVRGKDYFH